MADRGFNQDEMPLGGGPQKWDATYEDASFLGTSEDDEVEVRDLGFIVEDHDDRRVTLTYGWERLDELDTNEPLETNRTGPLPPEVLKPRRVPLAEELVSEYHLENAEAEEQEEDFVETSMLSPDPDMNEGIDDFTDETIHGIHGELEATDLLGHIPGIGYGFGTAVPQDLGRGGFDIRDNPLMQPENLPVSDERVSDEALGLRDVDEMGTETEMDRLADLAARLEEERERGGRR